MTVQDPYVIARDALRERWKGEATPEQVVGWIFAALDEAGDTTVLRDEKARDDAVVMAAMVFADLAGEPGVDYGALVSNVLRAVRA